MLHTSADAALRAPARALSEPVRRPPSWRRAGTMLWRGLGAAALVWVVVAGWPHLRQAGAALAGADAGLLAVAVVCEVAGLTLLSLVWRSALRAAGAAVPVRQAAGVALRATAVSRLLPGGGAAAGLFAVGRLRRAGVADGPAVAGVLLASATPLATLAVLVAAVGVQGSGVGGAGAWLAPAAGGALLLIAAGAFRSRSARRPLAALAARLRARPSTAPWADALDTMAAHRPRRRDLVATVACSAGAWTCELAALGVGLAAVAEPVPLPALALGLGAASAAAAVPHTPGGLGVVEASMTAAFTAGGLDAGSALGGVLAYRLVGFWLPVAIGSGLLGVDVLRPRGTTRAAHEAGAR